MTGRAPSVGHRPRLVRAFAADRGGGVTMVAAFAMLAAIGFAAVSVDAGKFFYLRRVQQSATDIAAIAAASDLNNAARLAATSTGTNRFDASSVSSVELGTFTADPTKTAPQRFDPTKTPANAVRVTLATQPPFVFGGLLATMIGGTSNAQSGFQVRTRAVATNGNVASFSLASGLATVNGGLENALMGALLGTSLSLSVMDWQALASAKVDMFAFASALNTRAGLKAATFGTVADALVTRPAALSALADALSASGASPAASAALASVIAAAGLTGPAMPAAGLVSFGPYGDTKLTAAAPITAKVTALDLLSSIAQVANGSNEVGADLALGIPGIAGAHVNVVIGQPSVSTGLIAIGTRGATLHTAQTRLALTLKLVGSGVTPTVNLPLYVELAPATAQLASVACSGATSQTTLNVTPGVADGWIGTISDAELANLGGTPQPSAATLFSIAGLVQVTGRAHASIANTQPKPVTFSEADIAASTVRTTSTTDFAASLYSSLLNNLTMNVTVAGAGLGVPTGLDTSVKGVLSGASVAVDQSLNLILSALGLSLGNASTMNSGVKCGRAMLVD